MKWLQLSIIFLFLSHSTEGQIQSDTTTANHYLERMVAVLEDESKEDSIFLYAQQALAVYQSNKKMEVFAGLILAKGSEIYESGYLESAILVFNHCIREVQKDLPDRSDLVADLYYQIGRAYVIYGQYKNGKPAVDSCLAYHFFYGDTLTKAMGDAYNVGGVIANNLNNFSLAESHHKKALHIYTYLDEPYLMSRSQSNLGTVYGNTGLQSKAVNYYRKAFAIRKELFGIDHSATANILVNLGGACKEKGAFGDAIEYLELALPVLEKLQGGAHPAYGMLLFNLGSVYRATGQFTLAEDFLQKSLDLFTKLDKRQLTQEALIYQALANVQFDKGNVEQAIELRKKELQLYGELSDEKSISTDMGRSYDILGLDFLTLGQLDSSFFYYQKAENIFNKIEGAEIALANLYNNMADAYLAKMDLEAAHKYAIRSLDIQLKTLTDRDPVLAYSYNSLAAIALKENQPEQALSLAQQAVAANHETLTFTEKDFNNPADGYLKSDYLFESILLKADAFEQMGLLNEANRQFQDADKLLDTHKSQLISRKDQLNQARNVYRLASAAIHNSLTIAEANSSRNLLEKAFYYTEKSKASVLAQSMTANNAKYFAGLPPELIKEEEQLASDINYYSLRLLDKQAAAQFPAFREALFTARQEYQDLIRNFENNYPFYYDLRHSNQVPQAKAIQFALEDDQAIISYFTTASKLYVFFISNNKLEVKEEEINKDFQDQVIGLYKAITYELDEDYALVASKLYKKLLPFEMPPNIKQLVFIPDGAMIQLPFEALLTKFVNVKNGVDFSSLPYLINEYQISYAPSASIFYQQKSVSSNIRENQTNSLVAFAPVFEERFSIREKPLANLASNSENARMMTFEGEYISPLPATELEVQGIQKVFLDNKIPSTTFLTKDATKNQLKKQTISRSKYLHIATHGFVNESMPDLSGLLFYPDTTINEDATLAAAEVYSLNLNAELVVLSACETGIGKITTGEGILGLSRAFLYAGAENLVVSLWKVSDNSTAQLMVDFYEKHLDDTSANYSKALREAKLAMIKSADYASPYYWSSFILIGE